MVAAIVGKVEQDQRVTGNFGRTRGNRAGRLNLTELKAGWGAITIYSSILNDISRPKAASHVAGMPQLNQQFRYALKEPNWGPAEHLDPIFVSISASVGDEE